MASKTPDIAAMIAAAVADAVAASLPGSPGHESTAKGTAKPKRQTRTRAKGSQTKARTIPAGCISALDAWMLLGADETYRPRDEEAASTRPASPNQLMALNLSGKLLGQ